MHDLALGGRDSPILAAIHGSEIPCTPQVSSPPDPALIGSRHSVLRPEPDDPMRYLMTILLLLSPATPAMAQRDSLLGRRVWVQGTVVRKDRGIKGYVQVRGDTLLLRTTESTQLVPVWPSYDQRLFVHQGRKPAVLKGALVGIIGGALVGLPLGLLASSAATSLCFSPCEVEGGDVARVTALSAAFGLVTGVITGATNKYDVWTRDHRFVPVNPVVTGLPSGRTGGCPSSGEFSGADPLPGLTDGPPSGFVAGFHSRAPRRILTLPDLGPS